MDKVNDFVERDDLVVVQLGAGDGTTDDTVSQYIRKHKWRGILIEPVDWLYSMLKDKYAENSNIVTLNAAVSDLALNSPKAQPEHLYWQTRPFDEQPHHHITMLPYNDMDSINFITKSGDGVDKYKALSNIKVVRRKDVNFMNLQSLLDLTKEKFGQIDLVYTTLYVHKCMSPEGVIAFLDTCIENDVKMVSYDKIPIGEEETFPREFEDTLSHPDWSSMGMGIGELDYGDPEFGDISPIDYGFPACGKSMRELDHQPGLPRIDRDLLLNKKYFNSTR